MRKYLAVMVLMGLFLSVTALSAPNFKHGKWKITSQTEFKGGQYKIPPVEFSQCLDDKNFLPRKKEPNSNCEFSNQKVAGDKVSWEMSCDGKGGKISGQGTVLYSGQTMSGEVTMVGTMQGKSITINNHMSGTYLGACN